MDSEYRRLRKTETGHQLVIHDRVVSRVFNTEVEAGIIELHIDRKPCGENDLLLPTHTMIVFSPDQARALSNVLHRAAIQAGIQLGNGGDDADESEDSQPG